jgi:rubrerythrin
MLLRAEALIFWYVAGLLALLGLVAAYYELRRKRFEPMPSEDHVFRCEKCAFVYTDDADVDRSRCPQCGKVNDVFNF